jgi:hypothetical protein
MAQIVDFLFGIWGIVVSKLPAVTSVLCFYISGLFARWFLKHKEQLFPVMALFALVWAIVVPYWLSEEITTRAALGVCTSFLTIYVGALLLALATEKVSRWRRRLQSSLQTVSFTIFGGCLFWAIVANRPYMGLPPEEATFVVEMILGVGGFAMVTAGTWKSFGKVAALILIVIFVPYTLSSLAAGPQLLTGAVAEYVRNAVPYVDVATVASVHPYTASVLKVAYTLVFGVMMMAYAGITPERRKEGMWSVIGHFVILHPRLQ